MNLVLKLLSIFVPLQLTAAVVFQPPAHPPVEPPAAPAATDLNKSLLKFVEDDAKVRNEDENPDEARAYDYVVGFASRVPVESFESAARKDITFAHMLGDEAYKYRGEVVHIRGQLKRIIDIGPTKGLKAEGIDHLYEAWLMSDVYRGYSYCLLFTELPPGLSVGEKLDQPVEFDGYFFKNYRFAAGDGPRRAPLLIGRTLNVISNPPKSSLFDEMTKALPIVLTLLAILVGVGGGLVLWLRTTDRRTKARIDQARGNFKTIPTPEAFHEPNPFNDVN